MWKPWTRLIRTCGFQLKRAAIALVDEHPSATMIYFSDDDGGVLRLDWHDEGA